MTGKHEDSDGRGSLRDSMPPIEAPAALDQRIRDSLTQRGLIVDRSPQRTNRYRQPLTYAAIAASFLIVGILTGRTMNGSASAATTPRYALLLYGGDTSAASTSTSRRTEYGQWLRKVAAGRQSFTGEELGQEVSTLGPAIAAGRDGGPLLGFFIIGAESEDEAESIARTSPHMKYGGSIVVQKVVD